MISLRHYQMVNHYLGEWGVRGWPGPADVGELSLMTRVVFWWFFIPQLHWKNSNESRAFGYSFIELQRQGIAFGNPIFFLTRWWIYAYPLKSNLSIWMGSKWFVYYLKNQGIDCVLAFRLTLGVYFAFFLSWYLSCVSPKSGRIIFYAFLVFIEFF